MTERTPRVRFTCLLLIATLFAGLPSAVRAEGGAADSERLPVSAGEPAGPDNPDEVPDVPGGEDREPPPDTKHLRTIPADEAAGILGKRVTGAAGEDVGMVVDVLIDTNGKPRAAVIDFGGFLGVGTRKIAVDWTFLQFRPSDRAAPILLDVTADAIRAAPEYRPWDADASVVVSPPDEGGDAGAPAPAAPGPAGESGAPPGAERAAPVLEAPAAEEPADGQRADPPIPEMHPPDARPPLPPADFPAADDLGPAPPPGLPPTPPDARQ